MFFGIGDGLVAKKKGPGRPKSADGPKKRSFGIRACDAWKTWLQDLATFRRKEMTDVVDEALEDYSAKHEFTKPPKR